MISINLLKVRKLFINNIKDWKVSETFFHKTKRHRVINFDYETKVKRTVVLFARKWLKYIPNSSTMYLLSKDSFGNKYKILIEVAGKEGVGTILEKLPDSKKFVEIGVFDVVGSIQDPYKTNLSSPSSEILKIGIIADEKDESQDLDVCIETSSEASEEDLLEYGLKEFSINTSSTSETLMKQETKMEKLVSFMRSLETTQPPFLENPVEMETGMEQLISYLNALDLTQQASLEKFVK
jgi:hypothetical protein